MLINGEYPPQILLWFNKEVISGFEKFGDGRSKTEDGGQEL